MSTGTQRTQRSQTAQGKARAAKRLMPYPEERALEHTVHALEAVPTRIHSVLLPVWCVEVEADVTEGEPYELIDRFLERGIAEAGLGTVGELAAFFALDPPLVGQAVRFLTAIGHVTEGDGRLSLTELGYRSVRDEVRYVVTRKDRRKLYFDGFDSRPLTRPYYDARKVGFLSGETLQEALERRDGPRLNMLNPSRDFRREALVELADSPERDRFNLPGRIDAPRAVGSADLVFLPAYLVRAVERGGRVRHFAYTPAADEYDPEITAACEAADGVASALERRKWPPPARTSPRRRDAGSARGVSPNTGPRERETEPGGSHCPAVASAVTAPCRSPSSARTSYSARDSFKSGAGRSACACGPSSSASTRTRVPVPASTRT
jgi:hypothetical protein